MITQEEYNKYLSQYYEVLDITSPSDMENIRELAKSSPIRFNITNDTGDFIDVNYRDILVTFKAVKGLGSHYDSFGGKAVLTDRFEVYSEGGVPIGVFPIYGYLPNTDEEVKQA